MLIKSLYDVSYTEFVTITVFRYGQGGGHWALQQRYVILQPKWVISELMDQKLFNSDHLNSSKNVSKIFLEKF